MPKPVDLRSDTVTRPVADMRRAIAEAVVGDDVFGDDPTVIELEKRVASLFEKEAALFVPSGTMGNHIALASTTKPGDEVILDRSCHIFNNEVAAGAVLAGVQYNALDGDRGVITAEQIVTYIRPKNLHQPETRVISIENTHNRAGGRVYPLDEMKKIKALAEANSLTVHLDGSRIANAVVATGISFADYAACADTINMCFSKGLGAPIGSIIAGDADTMARARKKRKQFGGGMRQVGIVAAAALYALDHHIERMSVDHDNAKKLASIIDATDGLSVVYPVETNILVIGVDEDVLGPTQEFLAGLKSEGVLAGTVAPATMRMVTHLDVTSEDIDRVAEVLQSTARA
jgi:threonine aldolase